MLAGTLALGVVTHRSGFHPTQLGTVPDACYVGCRRHFNGHPWRSWSTWPARSYPCWPFSGIPALRPNPMTTRWLISAYRSTDTAGLRIPHGAYPRARTACGAAHSRKGGAHGAGLRVPVPPASGWRHCVRTAHPQAGGARRTLTAARNGGSDILPTRPRAPPTAPTLPTGGACPPAPLAPAHGAHGRPRWHGGACHPAHGRRLTTGRK